MKLPIPAAMIRRAGRAVGAAVDFTKLNIADLKKERDRVVARADARNPPLTRVIPVTRPVRLAGRDRAVDELLIEDLARLQAWLEDATPHPLEGIPPGWADDDPAGRPDRLAAAWERAGSWPVRYGTAEAARLLAGREGRAYFLSLCLRRGDPNFGLVDALALADRLTPLEWAALRRAAYGLTPREEIADELAPEPGGRTANWCLSLHRASQHPGGPSYAEAAKWTVSQWRNFCAEGKAVEFTAEFAAQSKRVLKAIEDARKAGKRPGDE